MTDPILAYDWRETIGFCVLCICVTIVLCIFLSTIKETPEDQGDSSE